MAATLALPTRYASRISSALSAGTRLPVVWHEFQDCTGDSESFLRAARRANLLDPSPWPIRSRPGRRPDCCPGKARGDLAYYPLF